MFYSQCIKWVSCIIIFLDFSLEAWPWGLQNYHCLSICPTELSGALFWANTNQDISPPWRPAERSVEQWLDSTSDWLYEQHRSRWVLVRTTVFPVIVLVQSWQRCFVSQWSHSSRSNHVPSSLLVLYIGKHSYCPTQSWKGNSAREDTNFWGWPLHVPSFPYWAIEHAATCATRGPGGGTPCTIATWLHAFNWIFPILAKTRSC